MIADLKGFEGNYQIDTNGNVYSLLKNKKQLKLTKHNGKQPYYYVTLRKNGKSYKRLVHRLVAETFIENPNNKNQVNHKDGNVHNNSVENLEWVTNAENTQHAYDTFLNVNKQLHILYKGEIHSLSKWAKILNLNYKRTWYRINAGWSVKDAFEKGVIK